MQITPQPGNPGQIPGPPGTRQPTITIDTGRPGRPLIHASWRNYLLAAGGYDADVSDRPRSHVRAALPG